MTSESRGLLVKEIWAHCVGLLQYLLDRIKLKHMKLVMRYIQLNKVCESDWDKSKP